MRLDLDRSSFTYAKRCAQWAHRGRSVDELVAIHFSPSFYRDVITPRDEVGVRYPRVAATLRRAPRRPGRLSVVVVRDGDDDFEVRDMSIPSVDVPDARAVLPPLSVEQQSRVDQRVESARSRGVRFAPWVFDVWLDYIRLFIPRHSAAFRIEDETTTERMNPSVESWLQAAEVEREHGKLSIVVDAFEDVGPSVIWRAPEWFGVSRLDWKRPSFVL